MAVRYGLAAIKNVGQGAMEAAICERRTDGAFNSLEDFCRRLDSRIANRKMLESLVKCGAFDFLDRDRAELFGCIEDSLAAASASHRDRASGQVSLFDDIQAPTGKTARKLVAPWTQHESMSYEKELLGFYVTGHPLDAYAAGIAAGKYQTIISLGELADRATFRVAGAITQVDKKFTKKEGKPFAVVFVEDMTGTLEVVVWNEVYSKVSDSLVAARVIAIQGTLDKRDEAVRATAQKLKFLPPDPADAPKANGAGGVAMTPSVVLRFSTATQASDLQEVRQILATSPGAATVDLLFERPGGELLRMQTGDEWRVDPTPELTAKLARWRVA
jgi:DNA polymerase-3 subunit alpha